MYQPPNEPEGGHEKATHEVQSQSEAQDELPVSHCCAIQSTFSGSASPASGASPSGGKGASPSSQLPVGADISSGASHDNHRAAGMTASAHDLSVPASREQHATAPDRRDSDSMHGSDTADLARVQTAVYDGALYVAAASNVVTPSVPLYRHAEGGWMLACLHSLNRSQQVILVVNALNSARNMPLQQVAFVVVCAEYEARM